MTLSPKRRAVEGEESVFAFVAWKPRPGSDLVECICQKMVGIMTVCRIVIGLYVVLCLASLALVPMSAMGVIARDPLAGIFAFLLALPWSYLTADFASETSTVVNVLLVGVGMIINTVILARLCSWLRPRS